MAVDSINLEVHPEMAAVAFEVVVQLWSHDSGDTVGSGSSDAMVAVDTVVTLVVEVFVLAVVRERLR